MTAFNPHHTVGKWITLPPFYCDDIETKRAGTDGCLSTSHFPLLNYILTFILIFSSFSSSKEVIPSSSYRGEPIPSAEDQFLNFILS